MEEQAVYRIPKNNGEANRMAQVTSLSIIDGLDVQQVQATMNKIAQFQQVIQKTLKQGHDFGIIPGTDKPTLLKPGAEKILMLMGLQSAFEIVESTRDFEKGFFQYEVRCTLLKGGYEITEGLGSCNSRERKYIKMDACSIDNTVLKIATKRALVAAALIVAALSDLFTQDLEDMDLAGQQVSTQKVYTDQDGTISKAQAKRMFAIAGNSDLVRKVLKEYGYDTSENVKKIEYETICSKLEALASAPEARKVAEQKIDIQKPQMPPYESMPPDPGF